MDVSRLCRSCTKEVASWELNNFDQKAVEMFIFCTNIQILDDRLPKQFCNECTIKIETSFNYIKQAQEADVLLNNMINRTVIVQPENQFKKYVDQIPTHSFDTSVDKTDSCNENNVYDTGNANSNYSNSTENYIEDLVDVPMEPSRKAKLKSQEVIKKDNDTNKQTMKETIHKDETDKQICPICTKFFVVSGFLKRHIQQKHPEHITENSNHNEDEKMTEDYESKVKSRGGKKQKICPLCKRMFISELWFSRHMETEHSDSRTYICRYCGKSFATKSQLRYHITLHSESFGFPCSMCGKRFYRRKQLIAHAYTHTTDRPYACDKCDMTFKVKSVLAGHMKVHENEKTFLCYICGKGFTKAFNLTVHMHVHTGEKPYECTQCSFRASTSSSLRRHQRGHRAERKYFCPTCRRSYVDLSSLVRHRRTHTGERPYKCPHCTLTFIDSWKRKTHMMRSHGFALPEIPQLTRDGQPTNRPIPKK